MNEFRLTTDLADRIGPASRSRENLCLVEVQGTRSGPERPMDGTASCADSGHDQPTGWPGIDSGVRAPYQGECQLSWAEVRHAISHNLLKEEK